VPQSPRHSIVLESLFGEALVKSDIAAFLIQDTTIVAANEAACQLTGYTWEELVALSVTRLSAGEARPEQREAAERGEWLIGDGRVRRKDGDTLAVKYVVGRTEIAGAATYLGLAWEASPIEPTAQGERAVSDWMRSLGEKPATEPEAPGRRQRPEKDEAGDRQRRPRRSENRARR
jgi:PAS domain S-box-containing protein